MTQWQPHVALSASCDSASLKARVQGVSTGGRIGGLAENWHRNIGEPKALQCRSHKVLLRREMDETREILRAKQPD